MAVSKKMDYAVQQALLIAAVKGIVKTSFGESFLAEPAVKQNHIKWNEKYRMIVKGKERGYYDGSLVSCVTLYLSEKHLARKQPCGSILLYFEKEGAGSFLQMSGFPEEDRNKDAVLLDFCGEFCNMIAGGFINRMGNEGFQEILMTAPEVYLEEVPDGIAFDRDNTDYLEFVFALWNRQVFTIDLLLSPVMMKG